MFERRLYVSLADFEVSVPAFEVESRALAVRRLLTGGCFHRLAVVVERLHYVQVLAPRHHDTHVILCDMTAVLAESDVLEEFQIPVGV